MYKYTRKDLHHWCAKYRTMFFSGNVSVYKVMNGNEFSFVMELVETKLAQIAALVNSARMSQITAARRLKVSQQLVSLTVRRWRQTGGFSSRQRSGHPTVTSSATIRMIRRLAVANPLITSGRKSIFKMHFE